MPPKKELGRPGPKYPPRIDATPEEIAEAFFRVPGDTKIEEREYRCRTCGVVVHYPQVLDRSGGCSECVS